MAHKVEPAELGRVIDDPRVQQGIATIQKGDALATVVTKVTMVCFDKCVKTSFTSKQLSSSEAQCISNCALGQVAANTQIYKALMEIEH